MGVKIRFLKHAHLFYWSHILKYEQYISQLETEVATAYLDSSDSISSKELKYYNTYKIGYTGHTWNPQALHS